MKMTDKMINEERKEGNLKRTLKRSLTGLAEIVGSGAILGGIVVAGVDLMHSVRPEETIVNLNSVSEYIASLNYKEHGVVLALGIIGSYALGKFVDYMEAMRKDIK